MTKALVVGRRRKGRDIEGAIRQTRLLLEAAGWTVDDALVNGKGDLRRATARAVKAHVDAVVAVGGDGAVLQVIQALEGTDVALGIIPMGTGNLLAGNLGIPHPVERAVDVLLGGGRRRIDLGRLTVHGERRLFSVACGVGFDAEVMNATGTNEKLREGKLAYVANALKNGRRLRNVRHEITLDGVRTSMEATQVFIANFGGMGLGFEPRLQVQPDDGLLDVIVVRASGALSGLRAGWEAMRQGELGESSAGHAFRARARKIRIETEPNRLVETDGSVVGTTPIRVSVRPAALTVIIPAPASA